MPLHLNMPVDYLDLAGDPHGGVILTCRHRAHRETPMSIAYYGRREHVPDGLPQADDLWEFLRFLHSHATMHQTTDRRPTR